MKKIISVLLVIAMLVPALVACGKKTETGVSSGGSVDVESAVPEDVKFEGKTFTILCREDNALGEFLHEVKADEDATELVNEAVYKRNSATQERFGLAELKAYAIPGQWAAKDDFINTFKNSILADSRAFDMIVSQQAYMADPALTELYYNFYDVPYVGENLNAKYYFQDAIKELSVNNSLKFLVGDYCLTFWEYLYVMYFNKQLAENNQLEDLYALVKDGKWTIDKCIEMSKGVYQDLNGDSWPGEEDSFGYITDISNTTDLFFSAFDVQPTSKDEDGNHAITIDQSKMVDVLSKIISFKKTDDVYTFTSYSGNTQDEIPLDGIFQENRALFYPERLFKAQKFRGMETDFGIIPYPKWNEQQEGYYTQSQDGYSVMVIPTDAPDVAMSGAVIEVMSAISNAIVIPAYYDQALKSKYARDDQSGEMLDLVRDGIKINFGFFYGSIGMGSIFRQLIGEENSNFASFYAVNKKGYERNLQKVLKTYEKDN